MSGGKDFVKDSIGYGLGSGLKKFIGLLLLPFYTRALSPEEYGILDILSTTSFLISSFLSFGFDSAVGFYYYKFEGTRRKTLLYINLLQKIFTVFPILVLILFSDYISEILFGSNEYYLVIIISLANIPISLILSEQTHIYRYQRKILIYNFFIVLKSVSNILFGITLVVLLQYGIFGAVVSQTLSGLISVIISIAIFTRKEYIPKFNKEQFSLLFKFGYPIMWAALATWIFSVSDRYFILFYHDTLQNGFYSIGSIFSQPILLLNMSVQMSAGVLFFRKYHKDLSENKNDSKKFSVKIVEIYLAVAVVLATIISLFSRELISIIATKDYLSSMLVIPFLALSNVLSQLYQIMGPGINIAEKNKYLTLITIITAIINIILNFIFVPNLSYIGASITTLISMIIFVILKIYISQKYFPIEYNLLKLSLYFFVGFLISFGIVYLEFKIYKINLIMKLPLLLVVLSLPVLFGFIRKDFLKQLLALVKK